jgi:non-reducing end alpha-L-arabinofuranosidase
MNIRDVVLAGSTLFAAACGSDLTVGEEPAAGAGGSSPASGGDGATGADEAGSPSTNTGGSLGTSKGGTGGDAAMGGSTSGTGSGNRGGAGQENPAEPPCELLSRNGHACVSAHSTVRALVSDYQGSLYQVERADGQVADIGVVDGYADVAAQRALCAEISCIISIIYDQSGYGNDLTPAPPGGAKATPGNPAVANELPTVIQGRETYGVRINPGMGYRKLVGAGLPVGDEAQTVYMVTSQSGLINGCCFNYGNGSTTANNEGEGTTEAAYFGKGVIWGSGVQGGPWVMADLENGLYAGWENGQDRNISTNTPLVHDFVTAMVIGDTADKNGGKGRFALYGGDATAGALRVMYDGIRPESPSYVPMRKQGGIILGIGADNSNFGAGRFYEGVIATGAVSKETADALQAAIIAAGYGR